MPPQFLGDKAVVENSMLTEGCEVYGTVKHSVLFAGVRVDKGAVVEDSVLMPGTHVLTGAVVKRTIVAENCVIGKKAKVGEAEGDITLIGQATTLPEGYTVKMTLKAGDEAVATTAEANGDVNPAMLNSQKTNTTWINLPKFKADGKEITYTVEETKVLYNDVEVTKDMFTITGNGKVIKCQHDLSRLCRLHDLHRRGHNRNVNDAVQATKRVTVWR